MNETRIIYISRSTRVFERKELHDLLEGSRIRNSEVGITGILLFKNGEFLQVLEGEIENVRALYQKIDKDPRHDDVQLVSEDPCTERSFQKWSMGFADLSGPRTPGFSDAIQNHRALFELTKDLCLTRVLHDFKSGQLRKHIAVSTPGLRGN